MATGWTWEYVWENMTLQRLDVLNRLWKRIPPQHISTSKIYTLFAAGLGVEDEETSVPDSNPSSPPVILPEIEE